jgi:hypothetical protein
MQADVIAGRLYPIQFIHGQEKHTAARADDQPVQTRFGYLPFVEPREE